jgi:hypothetical protein
VSKLTPLAYIDVIAAFQALEELIGLRIRSSEKDSFSVTEIPKGINEKTAKKDRCAMHAT